MVTNCYKLLFGWTETFFYLLLFNFEIYEFLKLFIEHILLKSECKHTLLKDKHLGFSKL